MGLNEIRTLEDLKPVYSDLAKKYNAIVNSEKQRLIKSTVDEFINYFHNAKFTIQRTETSISAKYGNASAILNYENPFGWLGISVRMELIVSLNSNNPIKFLVGFSYLNEPVNAPASQPKTTSEEIEVLKSKIEELKVKVENSSIEPLHFVAKPEDSNEPFTSCDSITVLLNKLTG